MSTKIIEINEEKLNRLNLLINLLSGGNDKKFSGRIGVTNSLISKILNKKASISSGFEDKLRFRLNVNMQWWETGEGEIFADKDAVQNYPHGVEKFNEFSKGVETVQPLKVSDQLAGYSPEVKWAADYIEMKITGKTPEERFKIIEEIVDNIRKKFN